MTTKQTYTKRIGLKKIHVRISVEHRSNYDMNTNRQHEGEVKKLEEWLRANNFNN